MEPKRDKVGALEDRVETLEVGASKRQGWCMEDRVGALEDRSPQGTRLLPVPEIGLEPLGLVPQN